MFCGLRYFYEKKKKKRCDVLWFVLFLHVVVSGLDIVV